MEEKKKDDFFEKLQGNMVYKVVFFFVTMIVLIGMHIVLTRYISIIVFERNIREAEVKEDYDILTSLEASNEGDIMLLSGWVMRLNSKTKEINLFVKNTAGMDSIILLVESVEQEEVEEYFDPNWDFGTIGYETQLDLKKVNAGSCYELYVYLTYETERENRDGIIEIVENKKKIFSGMYLYNGELYRYNPLTFKKPAIIDAELTNVIENGILRSYHSETEVWIYQYDKQIYLITKQEYESMREQGVSVPIMPRTSRVELLPEHRIQYRSDHIGAYVESDVYKREGVLPYLVVVAELPLEYPITFISMGIYDGKIDKWIDGHLIKMDDWSFTHREFK